MTTNKTYHPFDAYRHAVTLTLRAKEGKKVTAADRAARARIEAHFGPVDAFLADYRAKDKARRAKFIAEYSALVEGA